MMATFIGLGPVDPSLTDKGTVPLNDLGEISNRGRGMDDLALPNRDNPCLRACETGYTGGVVLLSRERRQYSIDLDTDDEGRPRRTPS
jgi:hypothetical protein